MLDTLCRSQSHQLNRNGVSCWAHSIMKLGLLVKGWYDVSLHQIYQIMLILVACEIGLINKVIIGCMLLHALISCTNFLQRDNHVIMQHHSLPLNSLKFAVLFLRK
jgi:hypothetical protein